MALGAIGILGFFFSYGQVGSPAQAALEVQRIPWFAYASIFMWVGGMALAWYGRRQLNAAVRKRTKELEDAARVELD
jgi:predicted small integral membrane protein